jgi:hypothetical protein
MRDKNASSHADVEIECDGSVFMREQMGKKFSFLFYITTRFSSPFEHEKICF